MQLSPALQLALELDTKGKLDEVLVSFVFLLLPLIICTFIFLFIQSKKLKVFVFSLELPHNYDTQDNLEKFIFLNFRLF